MSDDKRRNKETYDQLMEVDILNPRNLEISRLSATQIKECHLACKGGSASCPIQPAPSCFEIMSVFCARAHQLCEKSGCNAVTVPNYAAALAAAKAFDEVKEIPEPLPHLWGVPLSVKDCIDQKGFVSTMGLASRVALDPPLQDGLILRKLKEAGALPFVRSNMPQAGLLPETDNYVFGRTSVPDFPGRSAGGSSGGEGGLLAARASPLGIGSDIGGSLRIPSAFCGLTTLKPTPQRITQRGMPAARKSQQTLIRGVLGPMAHNVKDCELFMRVFWGSGHMEEDPYTPLIKPLSPPAKLRVGFFFSDHWVEPCITVRRGMRMGVAALQSRGHECIDIQETFKDLLGWPVVELFSRVMTAEGNMRGIKEVLQGEKMLPQYQLFRLSADLPNILRPITGMVMQALGEDRLSRMVSTQRSGGLSAPEYHELNDRVLGFRQRFTERMREARLDCLLFPALGFPAFRHGQSNVLLTTLSYVFLANLLHYPAGTLPVTHVQATEQVYMPSTHQNDRMTRQLEKLMHKSQDLSVSLQLMAPAFQDECVLHAMQELETGLEQAPSSSET